ncbi:Penicillin-binding protein 1A/1B [Geobacillus sp. BCO2]|nr:Penicillin-binding protein 1A/1B [Geobacillus sp. BCO2]
MIKEVTDKANVNVFEDGLKIYTTLDQNAQEYVEKLLNSGRYFTNKKDLQSGIAVLDTKTGAIRALGGGRNRGNIEFGFNYAIQPVGQPGSTIKPILDYGPAIEYLKWSTAHILVDEPYTYSDGTPIRNAGGGYMGPITLRTALAKSRNIPALKTFQAVGKERAREFANRLGMGFDEVYDPYAIGGVSHYVSPLQMAGAYAAFGNNGVYTKPYAVTKIVFPDGTEMDLQPKPKRVMHDYTAYMITDVLKSVIRSGTGVLANVPGLELAGKTGTTNYGEDGAKFGLDRDDVPDSWIVAIRQTIRQPFGSASASEAARQSLVVRKQKIPKYLLKNLMSHIDDGSGSFKQPESVVRLPIKKGTNPPKLAGKYTPESEITYELFVRGTEPTETANDVPEELPTVKGLTAVYDQAANAISVSWSYDEQTDETIFEVRVKDGQGQTNTITTKDRSITISNPTPGWTYTIAVYAKDGERMSKPAIASVHVPGGEDQTPAPQQPGMTAKAAAGKTAAPIKATAGITETKTVRETTMNKTAAQAADKKMATAAGPTKTMAKRMEQTTKERTTAAKRTERTVERVQTAERRLSPRR